jgi:multisubunit Na+/H+ antiporter MnhG subunit
MKKLLYNRIVKNSITSSIGLVVVILAIGGLILGRLSALDGALLLCLGIIFFWAKNSLVTDLLSIVPRLKGNSPYDPSDNP